MSVRKPIVAIALESFQGLSSVVNELTEEEVLTCLELEAATLRRQSTIDRLISRAVRLRELSYATYLKERFNGSQSKDHDPG